MIKIFLIFFILISVEWLITAYLPDYAAKEAEEALLQVSDRAMRRYWKRRLEEGENATRHLITMDCIDLILEVHGEEPVDIKSFNISKKLVYFQLIEDKFQKSREVPVLECKCEIGLFSFTAGPEVTDIYLEKAVSESGVVKYYPSKKVTYDFQKWRYIECINMSDRKEVCNKIVQVHKGPDYEIKRGVRAIREVLDIDDESFLKCEILRCYYTDTDFLEYADGEADTVYSLKPLALGFQLDKNLTVNYRLNQ